ARVRVGRVHGGLLVPHEDVLELVLLEDFVVDVEHRAAGVSEDVLDTFLGETAHDDFRACDFHDLPFKTEGARPPAPTRGTWKDRASTQTLRRGLRDIDRTPPERPREAPKRHARLWR